jgi:O-antigen ligase
LFSIYFYFLVFNKNDDSTGGIQSFSGRTGIWKITLEHWSDRGSLLGNQGVYSLKDYSSENVGRLIFFHAHNLVLQYLWDWGLLGLVLVITFCLAILLMSNSQGKPGYLLALAIVLGGVIEITLPNTLLSSKFIFVLLLVKYAGSSREAERSIR